MAKATAETPFQPLQPLLSQVTNQYPTLRQVLHNPAPYRIQIIYTQIDRDSDNQPKLTGYRFNLDDARYYYPASTIKLPIALLALEWLNEQQIAGLTSSTTMLTDAATVWQSAQWTDASSAEGTPSIAHYIKKILLVSDNDASNRLYELLGQDVINQTLAAKGLKHTLINHRLSLDLTTEQNQQLNPIRFVDGDEVVLKIPARTTTKQHINVGQPKLGKAYMQGGKLINQPMDFSNKNRFSLTDFDSVIKRLVFPRLFTPQQRFNLNAEDRELVLRYMAMPPPDSINPKYDATEFPANYAKFLLFGGKAQQLPDHIKVFNKSGWAYGHNIDGAYVVDLKNHVEFFLAAVIYANDNDILNDDNYQSEETALPFLQQLGQYLYQYELTRRREHKPDLSEIRRLTVKEEVKGE